MAIQKHVEALIIKRKCLWTLYGRNHVPTSLVIRDVLHRPTWVLARSSIIPDRYENHPNPEGKKTGHTLAHQYANANIAREIRETNVGTLWDESKTYLTYYFFLFCLRSYRFADRYQDESIFACIELINPVHRTPNTTLIRAGLAVFIKSLRVRKRV